MSIFDHLTASEMDAIPYESLPWAHWCAGGRHHGQILGRRFQVWGAPVPWTMPPTGEGWRGAVAHWVSDSAAALMYLAWTRSRGALALLLVDESNDDWVVLTEDRHMHPRRAAPHGVGQD